MMREILMRPTSWLRKVCKWHAAYQIRIVRHLVYPFWEGSPCFREAWAKPFLFWSTVLPYTVRWETRPVKQAQSIGCLLIILISNVQRLMLGKVLDFAGSWAIWLVS